MDSIAILYIAKVFHAVYCGCEKQFFSIAATTTTWKTWV
jgi:hypothetical protein